LVKIVNNNGQYKITIPKDIVDIKGWSSKTRLRFVEDVYGNIILRSVGKSGIRIVNNSGQCKITIPKDIVDDKRWDAGARLRFIEDLDGSITLKEIKDNIK
jgi:bifunctional DNA-binding transcriptional regulator/antitoxin component of YhaV-PrlF toxin-antitoxin module